MYAHIVCVSSPPRHIEHGVRPELAPPHWPPELMCWRSGVQITVAACPRRAGEACSIHGIHGRLFETNLI